MENELHFLAVPMPMTGHMNCLLHLCMKLASCFHVRISYVCSSESYDFLVRRRNFSAACNSEALNVNIVCFQGATYYDEINSFLESFIQNSDHRISCILSDTMLHSVQEVSDKFGIPRASFSTTNALNDIIILKLPQLVARGFLPMTPEKANDLIDFIPGVTRVAALPLGFSDPSLTNYLKQVAARFLQADFLLCNTYEELEPDSLDTFRRSFRSTYYSVGPCIPTTSLTPSQASKEDIRCLTWLDTQAKSSVVYISFGTLIKISAERFMEVLAGVELSQQPFLLVERESLFEAGNGGEYECIIREFKERTRERGLVVSWAPQMLVLLHPAVGGFFTHCGWNSSLESIFAGVPMLALPCGGEQNVNTDELVSRKVAVKVESFPASRNVVAELMKKLVSGDQGKELRDQVGELSKAAKLALSKEGSSYKNLEAFVEAVKKRTNS